MVLDGLDYAAAMWNPEGDMGDMDRRSLLKLLGLGAAGLGTTGLTTGGGEGETQGGAEDRGGGAHHDGTHGAHSLVQIKNAHHPPK